MSKAACQILGAAVVRVPDVHNTILLAFVREMACLQLPTIGTDAVSMLTAGFMSAIGYVEHMATVENLLEVLFVGSTLHVHQKLRKTAWCTLVTFNKERHQIQEGRSSKHWFYYLVDRILDDALLHEISAKDEDLSELFQQSHVYGLHPNSVLCEAPIVAAARRVAIRIALHGKACSTNDDGACCFATIMRSEAHTNFGLADTKQYIETVGQAAITGSDRGHWDACLTTALMQPKCVHTHKPIVQAVFHLIALPSTDHPRQNFFRWHLRTIIRAMLQHICQSPTSPGSSIPSAFGDLVRFRQGFNQTGLQMIAYIVSHHPMAAVGIPGTIYFDRQPTCIAMAKALFTDHHRMYDDGAPGLHAFTNLRTRMNFNWAGTHSTRLLQFMATRRAFIPHPITYRESYTIPTWSNVLEVGITLYLLQGHSQAAHPSWAAHALSLMGLLSVVTETNGELLHAGVLEPVWNKVVTVKFSRLPRSVVSKVYTMFTDVATAIGPNILLRSGYPGSWQGIATNYKLRRAATPTYWTVGHVRDTYSVELEGLAARPNWRHTLDWRWQLGPSFIPAARMFILCTCVRSIDESQVDELPYEMAHLVLEFATCRYRVFTE